MRGIVILVLAAAVGVWAAEWITVEADADSYVYYYKDDTEEEPQYVDDNFGGEVELSAWYINFYRRYPSLIQRRSFIYFDFEGMDPQSSVLEAILSLYITYLDWGGRFWVYRCREAWDEYEVTWNDQPWFSEILGSWDDTFPLYQYSDVAELNAEEIELIVDNPDDNNGIIILTSEDWNCVDFSSREGGFPPRLKLLVSGADVVEASWGEIKAAFE
ncbi:MAG TPA: DNRLRE domain-containing protein [bacterium]|nr:DNRLRE domain-containing protein [bacterium]